LALLVAYLMLDRPAPIAGRHLARLQVACRKDGPPAVLSPFSALCEPGENVYFAVRAPPNLPYFVALATAKNGAATWFFDASVPVPASDDIAWIDPAQSLAEDLEGEATVYGVFSAEPLDARGVRLALSTQSLAGVLVLKERILVLPPA
jgi:hypothetical protein